MACSVAGITSDANVLTNELRLIAQRYLLQYQEPIPCEQLVTALCDIKQAYTQFGGKRPLVFHCFTLAGISTMAFSSIRAILVEIMEVGKPHALETIVLQLYQC